MWLLTSVALIVMSMEMARNSQTSAVPVIDRSDEAGTDDTSRLKRETFDMVDFLYKYGYLQIDSQKDYLYSEEAITSALKDYQRFNGLSMTGVLDQATMTKMKAPRCGFPDIIRRDTPNNNVNMPQEYAFLGTRWARNNLTWRLSKFSEKLSKGDQLSSIEKALALWAEVTPLSFQRTDNEPDMDMIFARTDHGDGSDFDGAGKVLAHAFRPGAGLGGDSHFDEDEDWTVGTGRGIDLTQVAAHEFGHNLGLDHSDEPGAMMAPSYVYRGRLRLHDDDIKGIQFIYGPKPEKPGPRVPTQPSTLPATTSTITATTVPTLPSTRPAITRTTTATTTSTSRTTKQPTPEYCNSNFRLDAISEGPDGSLYAFRKDLVYKFNDQGLENGYPKLISQVFSQAPKSVNAVAYIPETGKTYIFKDFQVWRYTNFNLDASYPKRWTSNWMYVLSAAMTLSYRGQSQIFMTFAGDSFWKWNPETERMVAGHKIAVWNYFPKAPIMPDTAYINHLGHVFFFKGNSYKEYKYRGQVTELKPLSPNLFGSVCGGQAELLKNLRINDQQIHDLSEFLNQHFNPRSRY